MISSTFLTFAVALSSTLAVNSVRFQRDGPATPMSTPIACQAPTWYPYTTYQRGDSVFLDYGYMYTAKQWSFDSDPSTHPDEWTYDGFCEFPTFEPEQVVDCSEIPTWERNQAYQQGDQVSYGDFAWTAKQWAEGNPPGDDSDSWAQTAVCDFS